MSMVPDLEKTLTGGSILSWIVGGILCVSEIAGMPGTAVGRCPCEKTNSPCAANWLDCIGACSYGQWKVTASGAQLCGSCTNGSEAHPHGELWYEQTGAVYLSNLTPGC